MLQKLKRYLMSLKPNQQLASAASLSILRDEYHRLLQSDRFQHPLRLNRFGYSLYSQSDEDGILEEIFRRIGETNRVFVEFGCGDGLENNSHALLLKGWQGLWIDGSDELIASITTKFKDAIDAKNLMVEQAFITRENINDLIGNRLEGEIDLLSIDIDGNDFHVFQAIRCINPRVVVVEYNARKGPSIDWVMRYNPEHIWDGSDYFGASLKAYEHLMRERGLLLVGCSISGVNAFFVREELVDESRFLSPYISEEYFEPQRLELRHGIHTSHSRNYGPWSTAKEILNHTKL
jgi:hypothetical protein